LPHWFCYLGNRTLILTHLTADLIIGISYFSISLTLGYLVWRTRGSVPFHWMMLAFGAFIIACGGTHIVEAITLWKPIYWFSAYMKMITAAASLATAIALPFTVPLILNRLRETSTRKRELESANQQLESANIHLAGLAAELRQMSEMKTRFFAQEAADIGDWQWDIKTGKVTWSKEVETMHGIPIGSFNGNYEDWLNTIHPEDRESTVAQLMTAMQQHRDYNVEYRTIRPGGLWYWTAARGRFLYDENGEPVRLIGMCMDVTSRHEAQTQIQSQARALDLANDAILILDLQGNVTSWNHGAETLYGWPRNEAIGKNASNLLKTKFPTSREDIEASVLRDGEWLGELQHTTKDGSEVVVASRWTLERDPQGRPQGWVEINRDITHQRKAEEVLRRSEKLAAAGRLAATIAHEINNPLEAVTNLIYLVRSDNHLPEGTRQLLDEAESQLGRVSHIARKTLGFYRDTSRPVCLNLEKLLDEILSVYGGRLQSRNIRVIRQYDAETAVEAVPGEIVQVFSNLIANAIDATPLGGSLAVRTRRTSSGRNQDTDGVQVTVADSGTGIAREDRAKVFEPFFTTKKDVGTGLGLWVAAELIRKHHGWIRMRSSTQDPYRGTTFIVFLPIAQTVEASAAMAS
jgi:PAS domain S-box-containing protein